MVSSREPPRQQPQQGLKEQQQAQPQPPQPPAQVQAAGEDDRKRADDAVGAAGEPAALAAVEAEGQSVSAAPESDLPLAVLESEKYASQQGLVYEESVGSSDDAGTHAERQTLELPCPSRRVKWSPLKYKRPKPGAEGRAAGIEPDVQIPNCLKERSLAHSLGIELDGLTVSEVLRDGCADRHGVRKGMTLKSIHGAPVTDERSLEQAFADGPQTFRAAFHVPGRWCPPPMTSASIVAFPAEKKMVIFGGVVDAAPTNNTWVYSHVTYRWQCLEEGRDSEAAGGGRSDRKKKKQEQQQAAKGAAWPAPRCGHQAAAVSDTEMVVFAGADISIAMYYNDLWLFDLTTYSWTRIDAGGTAPQPRWQFSMVCIEKRVYVYAGESRSYSILGDLHVYDHDPLAMIECTIPCPPDGSMSADAYAAHLRQCIDADVDLGAAGELGQRGFRLIGVDAAPRHAPPAVLLSATASQPRSEVNHKLFVTAIAGAIGLPADQLSSHREGQRRWLRLHTVWPTPPPRMMHTAAAVGDKMVVVGGVSPQAGQGSSVWLLECRSLVWREINAHPMCPRPPSVACPSAGHAGLLAHDRAAREQLPSADWQLTPFHTPTTHTDGKLGSLVGHVCLPYDNLCIVHGGKLDGRLQGDILWCLDLVTEVWSKLDVVTEPGTKKGDKSVMPSMRWKHCACEHSEVSVTVKMERARTLPPHQDEQEPTFENAQQTRGDRRKSRDVAAQKPPPIDWRNSAVYPLGVDDDGQRALKRIVTDHRRELAAQRQSHCEGLLMTQGSTPCVVKTTSCVLWGGGGQVKKTSDLWRLTLVGGENGLEGGLAYAAVASDE